MAKHDKTFYLHGGKKFSNLKGLAKELKDMTHDAFNHHVNEAKNDFANWAHNSLKDEKLAKKIDKKLIQLEMELEVLRHLVHDAAKPNKKSAKKPAPKKKATLKKKPAKTKKPNKKAVAKKKPSNKKKK